MVMWLQGVRNLFCGKTIDPVDRSYVNQLLRSSTSVAANYSAATCGRSDREFYAKICIVVEEADETKFWINFFRMINVLKEDESKEIFAEVDQLVRIFSSIKGKIELRLEK